MHRALIHDPADPNVRASNAWARSLARAERTGAIDAMLLVLAAAQAGLLARAPADPNIAPPRVLLPLALATWLVLALGAVAPLAARGVGERGAWPTGVAARVAGYGLMALLWIATLYNIDPEGLWGLRHLTVLDPDERAWAAAFGPLVLAPGLRRGARRLRAAWCRQAAVARPRWVAGVALVTAAVVARVGLEDRAIMSDGWGLAGFVGSDAPLAPGQYREPLAPLVLRAAHRLLGPLGVRPDQTVAWTSTAAIALMALLVAGRMRDWRWTRRQRALGWLLLAGSLGATQFGLGRIEVYGLVQLALAAAVLMGLRVLEGRASPLAAGAVWSLAVATHLSALAVGPACALAALLRQGPAKPLRARTDARSLGSFAAGAVLAALPVWGWLMLRLDPPTPGTLAQALLGSIRADDAMPVLAGGVLGPANLGKVLQAHWMLAGAPALVAALGFAGARRTAWAADPTWARQMAVLGVAWGGYAAYALLLRADWSWVEDWDLYSGLAPLAALAVMRALMPAPGVVRLDPVLVRHATLFALLLGATQHYYHHTRAAYLGPSGRIVADDRRQGRLIQLEQLRHGFEYGDRYVVRDGRAIRYRADEDPPAELWSSER